MLGDLPTNNTCDTSQQNSVMHIELPLRTKPTSKSNPQSLLDSPLPPAPHYCNAREKDRRQIFPPKRYVKVDVVAYALNVINGTDFCKKILLFITILFVRLLLVVRLIALIIIQFI